ncbi:pre-mRNA-splicing factor 38A [Aplysia californica]|uniref:Pre-mRNA-splicing factor 38 n=1 Tax=Aplysia californica TaxID=6500 RepID=A0ABM0JQA5_APLCA|nr:pre-mRNA-splicing factor 38A [Aplysia californica]
MANRTVKDAHSIKGTNPQYLVEKIIRTRIYECRYWKEECFALTAALLVDKAMELKYIGGVFGGNIKPLPFLCLLLKMLQIQPEKDIVVEFIKNEDFKYVRALGATYMRLTGTSVDCYKYLEPLYYDYRKLKRMDRNGAFHVVHMDEYIDELLREERICDIILPRVQKRYVLEETNVLEPRVSAVEEDIEEGESEEEEEIVKEVKKAPSPERKVHKEKPRRSPSPHRRRSSPNRRRDSHRHHSPSKRRSRSRDRADKRHRSPERRYKEDDRHKHSSKKSRHDRDDDRHRDRHSERDRHHRDKGDKEHRRHRDEKKGRGREEKSSKSSSTTDQEIKEANEMRARLGLPPLKP